MKLSVRRYRGAVAALAAASLLALTGCGSSSGSGSSGAAETPTIKVAILSTSAISSAVYVAQAKGMFDKYGVKVEILDNTGANTLNMVASGDVDLGMMASTGPLLLDQQGKSALLVAGWTGGGAGGMLIGAKSVTSIDGLKGASIGTLNPGTSVFGWATMYNEKYSLGANLVPYGTPDLIAAALQAGQIQGAVGAYANYGTLVEQGKANILIDTRDATKRVEALGPDFSEGAVFGLKDKIVAKKDAVTKFLAGYYEANMYIRDTDPAKVAGELHALEQFKATPEEQLTSLLKNSISNMFVNDGMITKDTWGIMLDQFAKWGISNFDATNAQFTYDNVVDMSYLKDAVAMQKQS